MADKYATAVAPSHLGNVTGHVRRTFEFQVTIDSLDSYATSEADEFVIAVNGRIVKRMNEYQARRMGLVKLCGSLPLISMSRTMSANGFHTRAQLPIVKGNLSLAA